MGDSDDDDVGTVTRGNVLNELKNLGACQAVLPLQAQFASFMCNSTETECMSSIDNYFDTTDIETILAGGTSEAADAINNNCKTYYLDYDFGEESTREHKIENLKKIAKSYCKSPSSGFSFVNNGLCLPQCKPLLDGSEALCATNNAFVGVGYKSVDNAYTQDGTPKQNLAFTNCCVDNNDTPGADPSNCASVNEQLRANAYVALTGDSGGYPGYLEQTIAADSSLRRALQETPDASDYSSDSSSEFTGDGQSGGGGGRTPTGGGGGGGDSGFGNWMGLSGSAQLNQTVSCLNTLFEFIRTYVIPVINDNAELRAMPNLAMLINPGYGVLPDDLPGANIEAFTGLTDFATAVIAGLGGEATDWQRISNYIRMATALRNFLLTHIDRAGVYLERLSTIQECLSGLAGGVAGARRYDSQIFMDLMDAVIDRHRETNAPGMDPTAYTPIVPWAALFGTDPAGLGDFTNVLLNGDTELDVGGHVVGYTTDFGTIDAEDIANEPYLFGNYILRRIQNCHRLVLAWRTQLARYLDYVNRQLQDEVPSGPQPEPEPGGDSDGGGGGGGGPVVSSVRSALNAGAMNVDQAADLLASASTGIAPTVTMEQALQDGTGGISITSTGPISAPQVRNIPADSNVVSIPIPQPEPEPEPEFVQARSGVTIDVTTEASNTVDTSINLPAVDDDGEPVLDAQGNQMTYHPPRPGIRPESVTITVGGGQPVLDSSSSSSAAETEEGTAADPRQPVNWDTAFQRMRSPSLIPRNDAITVQSGGAVATPPPIRPIPMPRDAPASDRRADAGLAPTRDLTTPLAGRTTTDLANSPTLMDNTNALRAAVGLDPLPAGAWNRHLPPQQPAAVTPAGGSEPPPVVPGTDPPVITPGDDGDGTEGDSEEGTTTPGGRPAATGGDDADGTEADTETGTSGTDYVHSRQVARQMRRRDGELRRRLTTVNYYNSSSQCNMCTSSNPTKSNQWIPDFRNDLYSITGTGDSSFSCNPTVASEDQTGPPIVCYDIYAGESSGLGTFGVRLPNVYTFNECRIRGGFASMEELGSGGYAPPVESYSITYQIPPCGNFDIDVDPDRFRCSDVPDKDTCEQSYYSYTPNGQQIGTYECVWDNQGNPSSSLSDPGAAGSGSCSRYIGESTLFSLDGDQVPNKDTMDLLVNKCQWRLGDDINDDTMTDGSASPQKLCHDYLISLCDNVEDKQSCIEDSICRGRDPSTDQMTSVGGRLAAGGPLVGTNGNWEVSPEMADACGGIPGRFGSRPDPDPGAGLLMSGFPGYASIGQWRYIVNELCEKNNVDSTGIWDNSYLTPCRGVANCQGKPEGTKTFNLNFFDSPRQGSPGYYCNYSYVNTQLPDNNCDADMGAWRDESEKQRECETRFTQDHHQCVYEKGFLYGDCNKGPACAGGANSNVYDCPSYGGELCQLYSDHCDWTPPVTTRTPGPPVRDANDGGSVRPSGLVDITTPGVCANKGS
jgi:hypothetical protein